MAGIDTGLGGFEIDGKVYEYDVGDPNAPGIDPVPADHGDFPPDKGKQDLGKKTRSTLGKYLSEASKGLRGAPGGVPNYYTVDQPKTSDAPDEYSITTPEGYPTPAGPVTNSSHFSSQFNPENISGVVADSPDLRRDDKVSIDGLTKLGDLAKGKQLGKKVNGNQLLPSVTKDNTPEPIEGYRSAVLSVNRFSQGAPLPQGDFVIGSRTYKANHLKQVGVMLSLRGSQEFPAAFKRDVNPTDAASVEGALIPSPAQLGVLKVPFSILEAKDALESLDLTTSAPAELDIAPIGNQSWGTLNNVEEPWSGPINLGMVGMALAMQVTLLLAFEGLGSLIGLIGGGSTPPSPARKEDGTYTKGSYLSMPLADPNNLGIPPNLQALLGFRGTRYQFGDALRVGASAFFVGADKAREGVGTQIVGALSSALSSTLNDNGSAGFIIIVSRMIVRSGQQFAANIEKVAAAFASNPLAGVKSIFSLISELRSSKLIAAMNIFAMLGDAILSQDDYGRSSNVSDAVEGKTVSSMDALPDSVAASAVRKSRLRGSGARGTKLAWASNRAPAVYLLPDSIAAMSLVDTKLGSFRGPMVMSDPDGRGTVVVQTEDGRKSTGARIPRESATDAIDVKRIESALEAEYVPFYFHDLRTNEIIAFHAFLATLSEDFAPGWETTDGYGRVDPVKVYKSTTRRISLSFYVAATSESDFDEMWMKVNKLITLVYPQYTKGRTLVGPDGTYRFTQPFSQLIGASPLIRMRLGDLFRSNYSRFALARLFGAADNDMVLNEKQIKFAGTQSILDKAKKALDSASDDLSNEWSLTSANWSGAMEVGGLSLPVGGIAGPAVPDQAPTLNIAAGDLPFFKFKIKDKKKTSNTMAIVEPILLKAEEVCELYDFDTATAAAHLRDLEEKYANSKNVTTKVIGGATGYAVPFSAMRLTPASFRNLLKKSNDGSSQDASSIAVDSIEELTSFLDVEKNALVKSFRATQGKGLAGVIESLNFDWYDKVTWDIRPNHRAPKLCKVSLSFAVIHDVSPGIDSLGYNRAPVYPVGGAMGHGFDPDKAG